MQSKSQECRLTITFIFGFLFGFIGSMPIAGPIAALIFVRSIDARYRSAFFIGLGSVLPESVYSFLAFWGFSTLLAGHGWIVPASDGVAGAILLGLGIAFVRRRKDAEPPKSEAEGWWANLMLGFAISGLNPTLIATWTGAATMLFSTGWVCFEPNLAWVFGLGAGTGIFCWYLVLIQLVRHHKQRFSQQTLNRVIRFFGVFLIGVSSWFLYKLLSFFAHFIG